MADSNTVIGYCTKLVTSLTSSSTRVRIGPQDAAFIRSVIDDPAHIFAEVYTLRFSEIVMIHDVVTDGGVTYAIVQRGMQGTEARAWPGDACVRFTAYVVGRPCVGDAAEGAAPSTAKLRELLAFLQIGDGLELVMDAPGGPLLRMRATGVVSGRYGGAEVNALGQLTSIPAGWPASAVPVFDACCGPDPAPGGTSDIKAVMSVAGLLPDLAGDVDLCAGTPSNVPITETTPVFVCAAGAVAKTTAGRLAALAEANTDVDLSAYVRSVAGLEPDAGGDVDLTRAGVTSTLTSAATVLVVTPDGLRRATLEAIVAAMPAKPINVTSAFDPLEGRLVLTINGTEVEEVIVPAFTAQTVNGQLQLRLGGQVTTVTLPVASAPDMTFNSDTGVLKLTVNGISDEVIIPQINDVPILATKPEGILYRLVRTPNNDYAFINDATA